MVCTGFICSECHVLAGMSYISVFLFAPVNVFIIIIYAKVINGEFSNPDSRNKMTVEINKRRDKFESWLSKVVRPNGKHYEQSVVKKYVDALQNFAKNIEALQRFHRNLFVYDHLLEFTKVMELIRRAPNFKEINKKRSNGTLSAAMKRYLDFLKEGQGAVDALPEAAGEEGDVAVPEEPRPAEFFPGKGMDTMQRATLEGIALQSGWENRDWTDAGGMLLSSCLHRGRLAVTAEWAEGDVCLFFVEPVGSWERELLKEHCPEAGDILPVREEKMSEFLKGAAALFSGAGNGLPPELLAKEAKETVWRAMVAQRVGQAQYRAALDRIWGEECAVTGCAVRELLRASHAKPRAFASRAERMDPCNGLLLEARFDLLFDRGLIAFDDEGCLLMSSDLSEKTREALHLHGGLKLRFVSPGHVPYLRWHRENVFRSGQAR